MKHIPEFENYAVFPDGKVVNTTKGNVLTPTLNENGYLYVTLWKENKQYPRSVHRLVAQAYIDNPDNKPIVNHLGANRANPHKDNLEWVTQSENIKHAYALGTMTQKRRLTPDQLNECLDRFLDGETMMALSEEYCHGLSRLSINLRNQAVTTGRVAEFTQELIRQKRSRNTEANANKWQQVQQVTFEGVPVAVHSSLTAATKALGKKTSGPISNVLCGRQKSAYGFQWKYL